MNILIGLFCFIDGVWQNLSRSLRPETLSYIADRLRPSKKYQFVVTAANNLGEGQWSETTPAIEIPAEGMRFSISNVAMVALSDIISLLFLLLFFY